MRRAPSVLGWMFGAIAGVFVNEGACQAANEKLVFHGMCDASAAVALDTRHFVAANDEDNLLRIYDRLTGGAPVGGLDVSAHLSIGNGREADIEGAARGGDVIYWITSHGLNKDGKSRPERRRVFATEILRGGQLPALKVRGQSRDDLLPMLLRDGRYERLGFAEAISVAPKSRGGFNIEGLAATSEGHLLIGLRNPLFDKKAIIIPIENPSAYVDGKDAELGAPILIDLNGQGIRCIESIGDGYLIVAGDRDGGGRFHLHRWAGKGAQTSLVDFDVPDDFGPEAMVRFDNDRDQWLVLSDDGSRTIDDMNCKEVEPADGRRFRGRFLSL